MRRLNTVMLGATTAAMLMAGTAMAQEITLQWQATALGEAQYQPIWTEMVAAFEAENPNIKIEPIVVPRADNWTKFVTAAQARQAPCVVSVPIPTAAYNGYLMSIQDLWDAEPEEYRSLWAQDGFDALRYEGELRQPASF